jgi:excinuclease UvrABC ATPase subunit
MATKKTTTTSKHSEQDIHRQAKGADWIQVKGARTHNLKNISVDLPRGVMTVLTGLSGSGKSSLAFDTIFAEGQRRYVESLSAYARQFLKLQDFPPRFQLTKRVAQIILAQPSQQ